MLEVPGHTSTHIAFHGHGCLFCGDTLFSVGCGRLFEGSPGADAGVAGQAGRTAPGDAGFLRPRVYACPIVISRCRSNPDNRALAQRASAVEAARAAGRSTVPSTLAEELAVNPFLRSREAAVVRAARKRNPRAEPGASTLAEIRAWKDAF